ncbi:MAG: hypothetical protein ACRBN8_30955 [Nannocystales bacterium]
MTQCKAVCIAALLLGQLGCAGEVREETQQTTAGGTGSIGTGPTSPSPTDPDAPDDADTTSTDGSSGESGAGDEDPLLDVGAPDGPGPKTGTGSDLGCEFIDVLFVVDISASMSQERANLAANFPGFVSVLDDYVENNGALGYRVGVTNSSINGTYGSCDTTMGLDGTLVSWGGGLFEMGDCGTGGTPWLDGPAAGLSENFSCLAENPIPMANTLSDCGAERPLGTMERFIDKVAPGADNDGFYRGEESLLVVINLTDEDEDSTYTDTSPAQTKAALDAFAGGEERYVAVTIAGPVDCESAFGSADEAAVLQEFTDLVPAGYFGNICEGDLADSLAQALELIQSSCDALPPPEG